MKKLVSVLLVLALALCAACAESAEPAATTQPTSTENMEFSGSFRGGITFGMTQDEVKAIETEPLSVQTFGEGQNSHVTVLGTDSFDLAGFSVKLQYLFWDGKFYALIYTSSDVNFYNDMKATYEASFGPAPVYSSEGTATWVENVSGNRPEMVGDQYVWTWANKISLTFAQFSGGYIIIFLDSN